MKTAFTWVLIAIAAAAILVTGQYVFNTRVVESLDPVASAPTGTKFIDIGGESMAYSEIDNHATNAVIFIGGLTAWHGTWQRTIDVLKKDTSHNYIALDLPPFGYSTVSEGLNFTRAVQARRILSFISRKLSDEKNLKHVTLVAHSYGAGPSAEAVLTQTNGVINRFVVIDGVLNIEDGPKAAPSFLISNNAFRTFMIGIAIHIRPILIRSFRSFVYVQEHVNADLLALYTQSFNTRGTTEKLSVWLKTYSTDSLDVLSVHKENYAHLRIPVRVIWGEKDVLTPYALSDILVATVPDVKRYTLKNVGHIPMIEDYDQFDAALRKALSE